MFCPNCGTQLEDGSVFCGSCGARMNAAEQPQPQQPQQPQYEQPQYQQPQYQQPQYQQPQYQQPVYAQAPKKSKKPLFIAIGAVAIVAIVAVVLVLVLGGGNNNSAKGAVQLYLDVMTGDVSNIESMAPKAVWEYLEDEYDVSVKDMKEEIKEYSAQMKEYGVKYSFDIGDSEKLDKDLVEAIADCLEDEYGIDADTVKEIVEHEVEMTVKYGDEKYEDDETIAVINIDGKWYAIDYYDYGDGDVYADFIINS